jgi:preprotein translocase subunit SecY
MKPDEIAKNLQKQGSFIPGIRPGNSTIKYINMMIIKLTTFGSIALALIAITPSLLAILEGSDQLSILSGIGGTSLLITVAVFMDSYRKAKSTESVQSYDIFK